VPRIGNHPRLVRPKPGIRYLHHTSADRFAQLAVAINNLWIPGWIGSYDKLAMTRRVMTDAYGVDIGADRDSILY
jgi:hypothetical protein